MKVTDLFQVVCGGGSGAAGRCRRRWRRGRRRRGPDDDGRRVPVLLGQRLAGQGAGVTLHPCRRLLQMLLRLY